VISSTSGGHTDEFLMQEGKKRLFPSYEIEQIYGVDRTKIQSRDPTFIASIPDEPVMTEDDAVSPFSINFLFPGDEATMDFPVGSAHVNIVEGSFVRLNTPDVKYIVPVLVGCVDY
jgi:hypothetical protein